MELEPKVFEGKLEAWQWYCRICGVEGESYSRKDRDGEALDHTDTCPRLYGTERHLGWAEAGHLLHVWRY